MTNYESHKALYTRLGSSIPKERLNIPKVDLKRGYVELQGLFTRALPVGYRRYAGAWCHVFDDLMGRNKTGFNTTFTDKEGRIAGYINTTPEMRKLSPFVFREPFFMPREVGSGPFTSAEIPHGWDIMPTKILNPAIRTESMTLELGGYEQDIIVNTVDYTYPKEKRRAPSAVLVFNQFPVDQETITAYGLAIDKMEKIDEVLAHETLNELRLAAEQYVYGGGTLSGAYFRMMLGRHLTLGGYLDKVLPDGLPYDTGSIIEEFPFRVRTGSCYSLGGQFTIKDSEGIKEVEFIGNVFEKYGDCEVIANNNAELRNCSPIYPACEDRVLVVPSIEKLKEFYPLDIDISKIVIDTGDGLEKQNPFNPTYYGVEGTLLGSIKINKEAEAGLPFRGKKRDTAISHLVYLNELLESANTIYKKYGTLFTPEATKELEEKLFVSGNYDCIEIAIDSNKVETMGRDKMWVKERMFWMWPMTCYLIWAMFVLPIRPKDVGTEERLSRYSMKGMALTGKGFEVFIREALTYSNFKNTKPRTFAFCDNMYIVWKGKIYSFDLIQAETQHNTELLKSMIDYYFKCIESVYPVHKFFKEIVSILMPFLFANCRGLLGTTQVPVRSLPSGTAMTAELNQFATICFIAALEEDQDWLDIDESTTEKSMLQIVSNVERRVKLFFTLEQVGNLLEEPTSELPITIKADLLGMDIVKFSHPDDVLVQVNKAVKLLEDMKLDTWVAEVIAPGHNVDETYQLMMEQYNELGAVYLMELSYKDRMLPGLLYKDQPFKKLGSEEEEVLTREQFVLSRISHLASYVLMGAWLHPQQYALIISLAKTLSSTTTDLDLEGASFTAELDNKVYPVLACLHPLFAIKVLLKGKQKQHSNYVESHPDDIPGAPFDYQPALVSRYRIRGVEGVKESSPSTRVVKNVVAETKSTNWADINDTVTSMTNRTLGKTLPASVLNSKGAMGKILTMMSIKGAERSKISGEVIRFLKNHRMIPRRLVHAWYYKYGTLKGLEAEFIKNYQLDHPELQLIKFKNSTEMIAFARKQHDEQEGLEVTSPSKEFIELAAKQTKANYLAWKAAKERRQGDIEKVEHLVLTPSKTKIDIKQEHEDLPKTRAARRKMKKEKKEDKVKSNLKYIGRERRPFVESPGQGSSKDVPIKVAEEPLVTEVAGAKIAIPRETVYLKGAGAEPPEAARYRTVVSKLNKFDYTPKSNQRLVDLEEILKKKEEDAAKTTLSFIIKFEKDATRYPNMLKIYKENRKYFDEAQNRVAIEVLHRMGLVDESGNVIKVEFPGV